MIDRKENVWNLTIISFGYVMWNSKDINCHISLKIHQNKGDNSFAFHADFNTEMSS